LKPEKYGRIHEKYGVSGVGLGEEELNELYQFVLLLAEGTEDLAYFDERAYANGLQVKVATDNESFHHRFPDEDIIKSSSGVSVARTSSCESVYKSEHTDLLVSHFSRSKELNEDHVSQHDIDCFDKAYGVRGSFGSRPSTSCHECHNSYLGLRGHNNRARPTPTQGPGESHKFFYTRMQNDLKYVPDCHKVANKLARAASYHVKQIDDVIAQINPDITNDQDKIYKCRKPLLPRAFQGKVWASTMGYTLTQTIIWLSEHCKKLSV